MAEKGQLTFEDLPQIDFLKLGDLSHEEVRVYEVYGAGEYRIENPVGLYYREGGTTHRVVDAEGICHCIPFPNEGKTAIRWKYRN